MSGNGDENGARSGALVLRMLSIPMSHLVLEALAEGPKRQGDLLQAAGSPARSTMRNHLRKLGRAGVIARTPQKGFPGPTDYELTAAGRELLDVAATLQRWLSRAPNGALSLGDQAAKAAIAGLVEGWSTTMLRALAARPLTLTELDGLIRSVSYPSLERRLGAMKLTGQIAAQRGNGRGTPYVVSDWTREAVAPLAAASRWERRHMAEEAPPISRVDIETAFLLAVPLVRFAKGLSGSCGLAVSVSGSGRKDTAGVTVELRDGAVVSCVTRIEGRPDAWIRGSIAAWMSAVIDGNTAGLEVSGTGGLAEALPATLHRPSFG